MVTSKEAALLYQRAGFSPPPSIAAPSVEHIRNTRRKVLDGIEFRSTLEADCYTLLTSWQAAGLIRRLELQPKFLLQPAFRRGGPTDGETVRAIKYTADFAFDRVPRAGYEGRDVERVVVEAKGFRTQAYELRRKLFLCRFPDVVYEIWTREKLRELSR